MAGEQSTNQIIVSEDPLCTEPRLTSLASSVTPVDLFFVRNHFSDVPKLDAATWTLSVDGEVENSLTISYQELLKLPQRTLPVTFECAGNSRVVMSPPVEGVLWGNGAVGNAEWTGVSLRDVLNRAGIKNTVKEILFEGADSGEEEEEGLKFDLSYSRSLPLDKAMHPDTLLAFQMNGEAITPDHGYPVRLIVPGWYGVASVKWLMGIRALDRAYHGFFQTRRYVIINEGAGEDQTPTPLTAMPVKSLITQPRRGKVFFPGEKIIQGYAWSGEAKISHVDVSTDGGKTWMGAHLDESPSDYAWCPWSFSWQMSAPGHYMLTARASDESGNTQPLSGVWNYRGYAINPIHLVPIEVAERVLKAGDVLPWEP